MAYSDFTLRAVIDQFGLTLTEVPDLFGDAPEVEPGPLLRTMLAEFLPLAVAISTEKARSELIIAPILATLRTQLGHRFSLFSGIDFTVDSSQGLSGFCDFILSRSPEQQFLRSPIASIVEAKNENIKTGLGQCVAEMVGAKLFNEREGLPPEAVFGAVTSGSVWRFLQLDRSALSLDRREYYMTELPKVFGILAQIVTGPTA